MTVEALVISRDNTLNQNARLRGVGLDPVEERWGNSFGRWVGDLLIVDNGAAISEGNVIKINFVMDIGNGGVAKVAGERLMLGSIQLAIVDDGAVATEAAKNVIAAEGNGPVGFFVERRENNSTRAFDVAEVFVGFGWKASRNDLLL